MKKQLFEKASSLFSVKGDIYVLSFHNNTQIFCDIFCPIIVFTLFILNASCFVVGFGIQKHTQFFFSFCAAIFVFFFYKCPGLCWNRLGPISFHET